MDENVEQERQAASDRLAEAWRRGYLDAGEHERRTTALRHARSAHEVEAAERGNLSGIAPDSRSDGGASPVPPWESRPATGSEIVGSSAGSGQSVQAAAGADGAGGVLSPQVARVLYTLAPLVAVMLFFATDRVMAHNWLWFLLIPITYVAVPALTRGDVESRRERRREIKRSRRRR